MADNPLSRAGAGSRPVPMAMAGAFALAGCVVLAFVSSVDRRADDAASPAIAIVRAESAPLPASLADQGATPGGEALTWELHGIDGATAWLAPHDGQPRPYRAGNRLSATVTLVAVRRGSVLLREGERLHRLDRPARLGGSGEPVPAGREGLHPSPQPPTGEASGAAIAGRMATLPPPMTLPGDGEQGAGASSADQS